MDQPLAYLISFTCHGTHLRGSKEGSVERGSNRFGSPRMEPNQKRESINRSALAEDSHRLNRTTREIVLNSMIETCRFRCWTLIAAHVRTTHVHVVVQAGDDPERIMGDLKSYASRHLNRSEQGASKKPRWTRHGSTKYLWKQPDVDTAVRYVLSEQGEPMSTYPPSEPYA